MKDKNMKIVPCQKGDFLVLGRLNNIFAKEMGIIPTSLHTLKVAELLFRNTIQLAYHENIAIGYVLGMRSQVDKEEGWIRQLFVKKEYRGIGAGKILVQTELDVFRNLGASIVRLTTDPKNSTGIAFFKKLGFTVDKDYGETTKIEGFDAIKDFYGPGKHRIIFKKVMD